MNRPSRWIDFVLPLAAAALMLVIGRPAAGQNQQAPSLGELLERFADDGPVPQVFEHLNCTPGMEQDRDLLGALLERDWPAPRELELTQAIGVAPWDECPDPRIDEWLLARVSENLDQPESPIVRVAIAGLERRAAGAAEELVQVASDPRIPEDLRTSSAFAAARAMGSTDRMEFFLDWHESPNPPFEYLVIEGARLASGRSPPILGSLTPQRLSGMTPDAAVQLVSTLELIVDQVNGASAGAVSEARSLLSNSEATVPEPVQDRIRSVLQSDP